jgi:hypothetical protein
VAAAVGRSIKTRMTGIATSGHLDLCSERLRIV